MKGGPGAWSSSPGNLAMPVSLTSKLDLTYWSRFGCILRMGVASSSKSGWISAHAARGAAKRAKTAAEDKKEKRWFMLT
jgi:hypothetical protein